VFRTKVLTAIVAGPVVLGLLYLGGWPLFIFASLVMTLGLAEFYRAVALKQIYPVAFAGWVCSMGILGATQWLADTPEWRSGVITGCLAGSVFLALIAQFERRQGSSAIANSGATVFGVAYVGLLFSFFLRLRHVSLSSLEGIAEGRWRDRMGAILLVVVAVWSTDGAAQIFGRLWGKRKLSPHISPNKTREGALAGLAAAVVMTVVMGLILHLPPLHMVVLGLVMGVFGELGDLCKSQLKRELGIKDFSAIIPGHGGVLDRFDSLFFTMPIAYLYFRLFVERLA